MYILNTLMSLSNKCVHLETNRVDNNRPQIAHTFHSNSNSTHKELCYVNCILHKIPLSSMHFSIYGIKHACTYSLTNSQQ
ncbi:hypothetical protein XELAEV_18009614mg [Xenopus laevis]|uniref:Uncharacterized protein n=1 Tax=Xenopus laevis TaxID=8355 RepID=A0A974DV41_XENLA|nr:hypothetical protein XELAEV_18009614mg [Xenopus laevis]